MITFEKQENGVLFTFENSDKYLYGDGTILVPFNSLAVIQDESDMITLRKSASWDIFLSGRFDTDFGYASKEEAVNALKEILYDEAGISEEEVQEMIDAATSGIPSSQVVEQLRTDVNTLSGTVSSHTADTTVHFTGTQKNHYDGLEGQYYVEDSWDIMPMSVFNDFTNDYSTAMGQFDQRITANESGVTELKSTKLDASAYTPTDLSEYWTSAQTQSAIDAATSGIPSSQVIEQLRSDVNTVSGKVDTNEADIAAIWDTIDEKEEVIASALTEVRQDVADIDAKEEVIASALTEVNQALNNKLDASAYTPTDLSEYWTSAQTQSAINAATSGIPSSQVIEQLRTDINTVSGDVENKQDALQFYFEDTEQWEEEDGDNPDSTAVFTQKQSDILTDDFGDEGSSQAGVQTRVYTVLLNGVLNTVQSESVVNIYANEASNDTEYGSSINVDDNGVGINTSFSDTNDEFGERLASINMNNNDVSISLESTANGDSTAMVINTSGVTINDERVATEPYVDAAISGKADTSAVTQVNNVLTSHTANTTVHVSQVEKDAWNAKVDVSAITTAITSGSTDSEIPTAKATYNAIQAGGGGGVTVDSTLDTGSTNPVANSAITTAIDAKISNIGKTNQTWVGQGVTSLMKYYKNNNEGASLGLYLSSINGKSIIEDSYINLNQFSLVETSAITTSMTSSSTDVQVPSAKAVYDQLGGLKFVKLTQAAYDALATKDSSTLYIISD